MTTPGHVIILNGTSSAGKSTLAKALQGALPAPYYHIGIDTFVFALPRRYLNPPLWHEVFRYTWTPDTPEASLRIDAGPLGHRMVAAMHETAAALARTGNNVIVDHVLLEPVWVTELAVALQGLPSLLVGVHCPLAVLEAREQARADRTLGQARAQFWRVHAHGRYDVTVDTAAGTPEECAAQILPFCAEPRPSVALLSLLKNDGTAATNFTNEHE